MKVLKIEPQEDVDGGAEYISALVSGYGEPLEIFFRDISREPIGLKWSPEAQICMGIMPAMSRQMALQVEGLPASGFLANMQEAQKLFNCWFPDWSLVNIEATSKVEKKLQEENASGVGAFFTGGVDSFFTYIQHRDEVTDWIFVHGYDAPLTDTVLRESISGSLRSAADAYGVRLIEIETNYRQLVDASVPWIVGSGPALAVIGHLLSGQIRKFYMASSYDYRLLPPNGTHPLLDHLWNSGYTQFIHDGGYTVRSEKVAALAAEGQSLEYLRVCWSDMTGDSLNCCRCEKCLRTMLVLDVVGKLSASPTFPKALDYHKISRVKLNDVSRSFWRDIYDFQERQGVSLSKRRKTLRLLYGSYYQYLRALFKAFKKERRKERKLVARY